MPSSLPINVDPKINTTYMNLGYIESFVVYLLAYLMLVRGVVDVLW